MANTQLHILTPAVEAKPEVHNPDSQTNKNQSNCVDMSKSQQEIIVDSENVEKLDVSSLETLNEKLRAANNDLYQQIEHLKDQLAESQKALQWQKRRSSVAESMLNQNTQELAAAQQQIQSLFQELETAVQTIQRQQNYIETYQAELHISQQRLAKLERECALLQTNYNEQSQQVFQSENACRELRSRLMRQQRQTLQFKAALEKCLEKPAENDSSDHTANHQTRFSRKARSLLPNVQPIQPWSAESESLTDQFESYGNQPIEPCTTISASPPSSSDNSPPIQQDTATPSLEEPLPTPAAALEDSPTTSESVSSVDSSKLDPQLESLIQLFFTGGSPSTSPPTAEINVDSNQTVGSVGESLETTGENDRPQIPPQENRQLEIPPTPEDSPDSYTLPDSSPSQPIEWEQYLLANSRFYQPHSTSNNFTHQVNEQKSPMGTGQELSPVVYPQRSPKAPRSLFSVQLPNFNIDSKNSNHS
jgi:hypothetical protein